MSLHGPVLDGVNDKITFEPITISNNCKITFKVKFNTIKQSGLLSDGLLSNYIRLSSTGRLRLRSNGNSALSEWVSFTALAGIWYLIEVVLTPNSAALYVDGVYKNNSGGTVSSFTANVLGVYNTADFSGAVYEFVKIEDFNTPANNRHWINEGAAGSNLEWSDISGNNKPATLTNTPTDGTQWLTLIGEALTAVSARITTSTAFRSTVASARTVSAQFRGLINRSLSLVAPLRQSLGRTAGLTTSFRTNLSTLKQTTAALRARLAKAVSVVGSFRERRGSTVALTAILNSDTAIKWEGPAIKVKIPLSQDAATFKDSKRSYLLNLSVEKITF